LFSFLVAVGDILYIENNTEVKADCVILKSSHPKGYAYLETSTVDGESDLKLKKVPKHLVENNVDPINITVKFY
jgi:P-type E1-E2 ATPase